MPPPGWLNATGGIVWKTKVGGTDWDLGEDVVEMPNKELVVLANTRSWGSGQNDLWFLRFGQVGDEALSVGRLE